MTASDRDRPLLSIVSAVYDVAAYLDEFIASIDAQTFALDRVQIIVVDDGSTDESGEILRRWHERRPELVTVLTKPNGGQASARNLGIEHARGRWITFPDPDDVLEPDYLTTVMTFLDKHPATQMVATRKVFFDDATGERRKHPQDYLFTKRNRLRNLDNDTGHFHGSAPSAFFLLDRIRQYGLTFDERIRPNFEDGHFCCRYLLHLPVPLLAFVQGAVYLYRKRSLKTSTLDGSWIDPGRMTDVPRYGYLALAREAVELSGSVPVWLQSQLVYELLWYFRTEDSIPSIETAAHGEVADTLVSLLREIVALLDPDVIASYNAWRLTPVARDVLLHGLDGRPWHSPTAVVDRLDLQQRTMRVRFRFAGELPTEQYFVDGARTEPLHGKIRDISYFDRVLLHERVVWLPFGTLSLRLDGRPLEAKATEPDRPSRFLSGFTLRQEHAPDSIETRPSDLTLEDRAMIRLASSKPVRRLFGNAWVLLDRTDTADDSAEVLFRWLRKRKRGVNAWFVVKKGTPDHARLRADGYKRVVAYGSRAWKLLMLNADHVVSSHADTPVTRPAEIMRLTEGRRPWRVDFLQHGVMKDDLSRWFNAKDFDLFVTSTTAEHDSVVGDHTGYVYTSREAVLTGLPRFDPLRKVGARITPEQQDLVLLAPTWRQWLATRIDPGTGLKVVDEEVFAASEFARQWAALARSPELQKLAEDAGAQVAMLLHPNLQRVAASFDLPPHVEKLDFHSQDVREVFARARVMVTDYSSMAFNAAYIDRPLVYFQFDRDRTLSGGHLGPKGYFDYATDGFGPLTETVDDAVAAIRGSVAFGPRPRPEYQRRIDAAFPVRDGKCTERVYQAIVASTKKAPRVGSAAAIAADAFATHGPELGDIAIDT